MKQINCFYLENGRSVMMIILLAMLWLYSGATHAAEQQRGFNVITIKQADGQELNLYKESHALLVGVSDYSKGWPDLPGVKKDIAELSEVLKDQGFHVVVVDNPSYDQLTGAISDFINLYGLNPENRLLLFFSGHGYTAKQSYGGEMGYIVPSDTPDPNKDFRGFLQKAVDMQQIEVFAKRIQARHALFVFDSCFSGSIFSITRDMPKNITYKIGKPVRQFITSGSADEKVPDESIFLDLLIIGIAGEGDLNEDGYVTGTELGSFLQDNVIDCTHGFQHPQFGKIRNLYLSKGDFVFVLGPEGRDTSSAQEDAVHTDAWKKRLSKGAGKQRKTIVPIPSF